MRLPKTADSVRLDDDFEPVDGLSATIVLDPDEFVELNEFLGY